jgi:hypothetical protein
MSQQLFAPAVATPLNGEPQPHQAALLLGAMSGPDRAWVLARLPAEDRAILVPLLSELEALGIPVDAALLDAVREKSGRNASPPVESAVSASAADEAAILDAPPALLAKVLAQEPAGLIGQLLSIRAWPWHAEVIRLLPASKTTEIKTYLMHQVALPSLEVAKDGPAPHGIWRTRLMRALRVQLERANLSSEAAASPGRAPYRATHRPMWWHWRSPAAKDRGGSQ